MIRLLYFASLRDRLGSSGEELALPENVGDIAGLKALLARRGDTWSEVFAEDELVLAAVNQEMAQPETAITDGDEIGFFPPVTGG
ncbi:MAG TPA: molybdopterin converting factor subunit 1 [Chromatiaceae bacterium]|nr:molybdopterin converting factor subunit 1 [Chromatiaceae bacterium]